MAGGGQVIIQETVRDVYAHRSRCRWPKLEIGAKPETSGDTEHACGSQKRHPRLATPAPVLELTQLSSKPLGPASVRPRVWSLPRCGNNSMEGFSLCVAFVAAPAVRSVPPWPNARLMVIPAGISSSMRSLATMAASTRRRADLLRMAGSERETGKFIRMGGADDTQNVGPRRASVECYCSSTVYQECAALLTTTSSTSNRSSSPVHVVVSSMYLVLLYFVSVPLKRVL